MTPINENVCMNVCTSPDDFNKLKQGLTLLEQAKSLDHQRDYYAAIRHYRDGVDFLMDEFMSRTSANEQSKEYLRLKCHQILNRVDILKKLIKQQEHETMQKAVDHDDHDAGDQQEKQPQITSWILFFDDRNIHRWLSRVSSALAFVVVLVHVFFLSTFQF